MREFIAVDKKFNDLKKYDKLKQDYETKLKQFKKFKYNDGFLTFYYKYKLKQIKKKINNLL